MARNLVFISHANPEDNEFSRWLALQLAKNGYRVWCDLTRFLGGEDFWSEIERAIREETCKFIYILSQSSNHRDGTLKELRLAINVARLNCFKDFVIPVKVDSLQHEETNVELGRLIAVDCSNRWDKGISSLIDKLEEDKVAKDERFSPDSVASWWKGFCNNQCRVQTGQQKYVSNWYKVIEPLPDIKIHSLKSSHDFLLIRPLRYPKRRNGASIITFADAKDICEAWNSPDCVEKSFSIAIDKFREGVQDLGIRREDAQRILVDLMRQAWEKNISSFGMWRYRMSSRRTVGYYCDGVLGGNRVEVPLSLVGQKNSSRGVVGFRIRKDLKGQVIGKRHWHFAVEMRPILRPILAYALMPHVVFSNDGKNILESKEALHRLRRSMCKDWWNADWRDRLLGTFNHLCRGSDYLNLEVGSGLHLAVEARPTLFASSVCFFDPSGQNLPGDPGEEDFDNSEDTL